MPEIKAIETVYNGYRFRSRLEARWAVFFDAANIRYEYEPEGYEYWEGEDGKCRYTWLPDFRLPDEDNLLVEVKGGDEKLTQDWERLAMAVDWMNTPAGNGLLILGDIPPSSSIGWGKIPVFSYLEWHKGVQCDYAAFINAKDIHIVHGMKNIFNAEYSYGLGKFPDDWCDGFDEKPECVSTICKTLSHDALYAKVNKRLKRAFEIARQARFEHGETPTVESIMEMMKSGL